jgi:hypothetical protein
MQFVSEFQYLGHMVNNDFSNDDDVKREIRNMFMRTNILIRRYAKCSFAVKLILFKACACLMWAFGCSFLTLSLVSCDPPTADV